MSLQTGGRPWGAISTRSRSASTASLSAWSVGTMPTVSPLGPTSRTSGTRIRSLMRSSVLMGPPVVRVGGSPPPGPADVPEMDDGSRCCQAGASHDTSPLSGKLRCPPPSRDGCGSGPGPDDLWCWAIGAGGRRWCLPPLGGISGTVKRGVTDRSTQKASGSFRRGANPAVTTRAVADRDQPPACCEPAQVVAVDDVRRGAGEVHEERLGAVLDRRGGGRGGGHRHRAGLRVPPG